jgi:hypothetical protein
MCITSISVFTSFVFLLHLKMEKAEDPPPTAHRATAKTGSRSSFFSSSRGDKATAWSREGPEGPDRFPINRR